MFIPLIPPPVHNLCHCRILLSTLRCNFCVGIGGVKRRGVVKEEAVGTLSSVDNEIVEFEVLEINLVSGDYRHKGKKYRIRPLFIFGESRRGWGVTYMWDDDFAPNE